MKTPFQLACSYYGLKEVKGEKHNPQILDFFNEIGHQWVQTDETAWCAAFVNFCCLKAIGKQTGKLNARSFLKFGIETNHPVPGDIVVIWRESIASWKGHVGFYINHDKDNVYILGGNQSNQVNVTAYPIDRVLSYRRGGL
jgi:uncharacterized protein (TIGR02594 family)